MTGQRGDEYNGVHDACAQHLTVKLNTRHNIQQSVIVYSTDTASFVSCSIVYSVGLHDDTDI